MKSRLVMCVLVSLAAGCAELSHDGTDGWVDRTYRTGSNLPRKSSAPADGVAVVEKEQVDTWRSQNLPPGVPCSAFMGCGAKGR
ncbi:MAG TPA: hypothetical protein VN598_01320 [Usitatibacter sp.]|nr:hypothetical protein [Usitatibacter sp.]